MSNTAFAVFHTTKLDGQMNGNKQFYPEGMSEEERNAISRFNKSVIAHQVGFNLNHLFMSLQGKERGTVYTLTKKDVVSYQDLYDYDVYADHVKMTPETMEDKTAIGFNVSDGANVIAMNVKTMEATSTFCSGAHINNEVPRQIRSVLGGKKEDIYVDVSPFAYVLPMKNPENKDWEPDWVSNKDVWGNNLVRSEDGTLYVGQYPALMRQLTESGILEDHITVRLDTYHDHNYYSSQRARMENDPQQNGRFMHGVAYVEEDKTYENANIKVYKKAIVK